MRHAHPVQMKVKPSTDGFAGALARVPVIELSVELASRAASDDDIMPQPAASFDERFTAVWNR